ncbi:MAG: ATPase, T2SS/T4P/T4SS family [Promethearchaeota archaeon]
MTTENLNYFQERENLDGKKEAILLIDCNKCLDKDKNFFKNISCRYCLLSILFKNRKKRINEISLLGRDFTIESHNLNLILDYFKKLNKIKKVNKKIEEIKNKKCIYGEFKCKFMTSFSSANLIQDFEYNDPIFVFELFTKKNIRSEKKIILDPKCEKCYTYIKNSENYIINLLENLNVIKEFKTFQNNKTYTRKFINFYEYIFSKFSFLEEKTHIYRNSSLNENLSLLSEYTIGEDEIFQIQVYRTPFEYEKRYFVKLNSKDYENFDFSEKIINDLIQNIEVKEFNHIIPLETLIEIYKDEILKDLNLKYKFSKIDKSCIAYLTTLKKLNLHKLFPLLIDNSIEEIFLDSPNDEIYINHQEFGRCRTSIRFTLKDIERLKTLIRLYSGKRLDYMNPQVKYVIKNKFFNCRFAIDIDPIQINGFALDIRKLNKNILTIQDLLKCNTLDPLMAAFLYFNLLRKNNITVTGETDTGKTTLINALDLLAPKEFRKIYVENITESLNQNKFGKHQLKYRADSLDDLIKQNHSKSILIKTLLHRTPDIIYLGEILTKEETEALFHCLAAGLKGFQTIHSNNIESLIHRFLYHFKINKSCLYDLDLIILMKKDFNRRRIVSLVEIDKINYKDDKYYSSIFQYSPKFKNWKLLKNLFNTSIISELRKYEDLSENKFNLYINIYYDIFEFLSKIHKIENNELIELFHRISYYSSKSIESLIYFWDCWKKTRSLN